MADASKYELTIDASEFNALFGKASEVEKKLKAQLRKNIKAAAMKAAEATRQEVQQPPLERGKHPQNRHLRSTIASGIKVQIAANSSRGAGVIIKASAANLEGDRKKLVRAYDLKKGWRHPIFARIHHKTKAGSALKAIGATGASKDFEHARRNLRRSRAKWVVQKGRPYFNSVIRTKQHEVLKAVEEAMKTAMASLK